MTVYVVIWDAEWTDGILEGQDAYERSVLRGLRAAVGDCVWILVSRTERSGAQPERVWSEIFAVKITRRICHPLIGHFKE